MLVKSWIWTIFVLFSHLIAVTQRMLELEKECGTQKRLNDAMQREKERVLEKSAHMVLISLLNMIKFIM